MNFIHPDLTPALPEIFLLVMACVVLLVDLFWPGTRRRNSYYLSQLALLGAAVMIPLLYEGPSSTFDGFFVHDELSVLAKFVILLTVSAVFLYSRAYMVARGLFSGEFLVLGLLGAFGMQVIASAGSLLTVYLGVEILSLCLYALVAMNRDSMEASEAAIKYFFLGALASGMLLYGMSLVYGMTGSLDIQTIAGQVDESLRTGQLGTGISLGVVFLVIGLAFKLGAAPFHFWVPDVYQGAPTSIAMYLGTASKLAAFTMAIRLLADGLQPLMEQWQLMLVLIAVLSLAIGNLVAIVQTNIKRMLAYSTISHMGFLLLGIINGSSYGYGAALFYSVIYAMTSLGAFAMIMLLSRKGFEADELDDFRGLNQRSPWYAFIMLVLMFSMAGVPPTAGFLAKYVVIQSVLGAGFGWLAVLAVLFSVIGAFYYLRVIKLMYFDQAVDDQAIVVTGNQHALISLNGLSLLLLGVLPGPLLTVCELVF